LEQYALAKASVWQSGTMEQRASAFRASAVVTALSSAWVALHDLAQSVGYARRMAVALAWAVGAA